MWLGQPLGGPGLVPTASQLSFKGVDAGPWQGHADLPSFYSPMSLVTGNVRAEEKAVSALTPGTMPSS